MTYSEEHPTHAGETRPSPARVYDAALGGSHNYKVDRAHLAKLNRISHGDATAAMRANRRFLGRAVRFVAERLVEQGHEPQFLDVGSGLPTLSNTHELAWEVAGSSRTVYVDNDPVVTAHGRALLQTERVEVEEGDLRDPAGILRSDSVRRLIDWERPVGLLLVAVLHFIPDPLEQIMRVLCERMAPGSYLVISHGAANGRTVEELRQADQAWEQATERLWLRTYEEVLGLFDGFELVSPGLVSVTEWPHPSSDTEAPRRPLGVLGGVGQRT